MKEKWLKWFFIFDEFFSQYMEIVVVDDTNVLWENGVKSGEHLTESAFERRLKNTLIPVCRDDNQVQTHVERMLVQRLTFPRELAEQYSKRFSSRPFDLREFKYFQFAEVFSYISYLLSPFRQQCFFHNRLRLSLLSTFLSLRVKHFIKGKINLTD